MRTLSGTYGCSWCPRSAARVSENSARSTTHLYHARNAMATDRTRSERATPLESACGGLRKLVKQGTIETSAVLTCPELTALAPDWTHQMSEHDMPAIFLSEAIDRAIGSIKDPSAARALFGRSASTAGLPLGRRRAAAAEILEIQPESFRVRREARLVNQVANALLVDLASSDSQAAPPAAVPACAPNTTAPDWRETSLASELSAIVGLYQECLTQGEFGQLSAEWALEHLIVDARLRLQEITSGRLPVRNRAPVRSFWHHSVFGRAAESVWTTNVGKPGATIGGTRDPQLLAAQEAAQKRGVSITRLFVFDPDMTAAEAEERRRVMHSQIEANIRVLVMPEWEFRNKANAENATMRIGSDDFMIVDERFVYLTFPDESDAIEAALLDGQRHVRRLEAALEFRYVLEAWAAPMTADGIESFPSHWSKRTATSGPTPTHP